jgi:hypothetical protein
MTDHERIAGWLERVCLGFVALGALLPLVFPTAPFSLYRDAVAEAIGDARTLDLDAARLAAGITGGSIAGKWILHWAIVRFGVRARRRWALNATIAGLLAWFFVDSVSSLLGGAWANVVMINGMPLLLVLPLAWRLRASCERDPSPPLASESAVTRLAMASGMLGIVSGLVIAFGTESPAFDAWWSGLGAAQFEGHAVPTPVHALVRFFAGPIGGSTAGHCVLLVLVARRGIAAADPWAWRWSAISVLGWALLDSGWSLAARGAFNVVLVNVPCALLLLTPLAWAGWRQRRARP